MAQPRKELCLEICYRNCTFGKKNVMETIRIEILNPKANQLLKDLADLNLIKIQPKLTISEVLEKTRQSAEYVPNLDEITAEVEEVRQSRYFKKN
jgi:hypothetical protein